MNETGYIYLITNKLNGKHYVGQTRSTLPRRFNGHVTDSKRRDCMPICRAIKKYGRENFAISQLAQVDSPNLIDWLNFLEPIWIEALNSFKPHGYNVDPGGRAAVRTPETRAKISAARKGKKNTHPRSEEYRANMRAKHLGAKRSDESRARMSAAQQKINLRRDGKRFIGRPHTEETRRKLSEIGRNRTVSDETRAKISAANKGHVPSRQTREKISQSLKGHPVSEATRRKVGEGNRGKKRTEEYKRWKSNSLKGNQYTKGHKHSAETRAKMSATRTGKSHPRKSRQVGSQQMRLPNV